MRVPSPQQTQSRRVFSDKTNTIHASQSTLSLKRGPSTDIFDKPAKLPKLLPLSEDDTPLPSRHRTDALICMPHRSFRNLQTSSRILDMTTRVSTKRVLDTFVSSNLTDVYKVFGATSSQFALPTCCAYSHDAKMGKSPLLAVATELGSIELFTTEKRNHFETPSQRTSMVINDNMLFDIKWSVDDQYLAAASADHTVYILDPSTQQLISKLRGHAGSVKVVAWDPNHRALLASASRQGDIRSWDLRMNQSRNQPSSFTLEPRGVFVEKDAKKRRNSQKSSTRSITSLLYTNAEPYHLISSNSIDGVLTKWDSRFPISKSSHAGVKKRPIIRGPLETSSVDPTLEGHSKRSRGISSLAMGNSVIYGLARDSRIHSYSLNLSTQVHGSEATMSDIAMKSSSFYSRLATNRKGSWVAAGDSDGSVFLFDIQSCGKTVRPAVCLTGHEEEVGGLDWAGDILATCSDDRTIRVWRPDAEVYQSCIEKGSKDEWRWAGC